MEYVSAKKILLSLRTAWPYRIAQEAVGQDVSVVMKNQLWGINTFMLKHLSDLTPMKKSTKPGGS